MVERSLYNRLSLNLNIYQDRAVEGNRSKTESLFLHFIYQSYFLAFYRNYR